MVGQRWFMFYFIPIIWSDNFLKDIFRKMNFSPFFSLDKCHSERKKWRKIRQKTRSWNYPKFQASFKICFRLFYFFEKSDKKNFWNIFEIIFKNFFFFLIPSRIITSKSLFLIFSLQIFPWCLYHEKRFMHEEG